ncbi:hypothetical protein T492DRAFT_917405, partial [Pavlovales sp. CCMP2436]
QERAVSRAVARVVVLSGVHKARRWPRSREGLVALPLLSPPASVQPLLSPHLLTPELRRERSLSQSKLGRLQVRGWRRVRPRGEAHQVNSRRCPSDEGGACDQATTRAPSHSSKTSETTHRRARASSRQFTPRRSRLSSSKRTEVYLHVNSFADADLIRRELIGGAR